jgi:hypothetical protein
VLSPVFGGDQEPIGGLFDPGHTQVLDPGSKPLDLVPGNFLKISAFYPRDAQVVIQHRPVHVALVHPKDDYLHPLLGQEQGRTQPARAVTHNQHVCHGLSPF